MEMISEVKSDHQRVSVHLWSFSRSLLQIMLLLHTSFCWVNKRRMAGWTCRAASIVTNNRMISMMDDARQSKEYIMVPRNSQISLNTVEKLCKKRPNVIILPVDALDGKIKPMDEIRWLLFRNGLNIDSTVLESHHLGKVALSEEETAQQWHINIERRSALLQRPLNLGDGGRYQSELNAAIAIVQRASYASRSLQQRSNILTKGAVNKLDTSPVTVADFSVQAIVINALHKAFPNDSFIAEEDSSYLQQNPAIAEEVLAFVQASIGEEWSLEQLYQIIDLGGKGQSSSTGRVWVLDPIDGTKGFIRSQHYCIALSLLVNGKPSLSVLGCPNLDLLRVLDSGRDSSTPVEYIPPSIALGPDANLQAFHQNQGSIYFAVTGCGAFARSLDMPLGGGFEISVSTETNPVDAVLCESYEAAFGSREQTTAARSILNMKADFVRIDGQGKHCLVAAGRTEGSLRLPKDGYIEKIWDHAPGYHLLNEAGGKVTDLQGRDIDFSKGRELDESVHGLIVSNGVIHDKLIKAVLQARHNRT